MLNFKERDIAGGDFLYGERIELVRIITNNESTDFEKIRDIMKLLHDIDITPRDAASLFLYVSKIIEGINGWLTREKDECYVPPTPDQMAAGIEKMAEEVGDMGGVVSIAEQRGWTFEQVLKMPYTEVFTTWKVNAASARYDQRFADLMKRKSNSHGRHS